MACVLFSRPSDDVTLSYLFFYSKDLVSISDSIGHKTINKELENANRRILISVIKKQNPDLIMFSGHGSPTEICGHKQEVIISSEENSELLKNTIT